MYLGSFDIDDLATFAVSTHTPSTGAAVDADSVPTYRVYEDETGTPILTGSMALLDDANTVGQYSEQITLSVANGFEAGKSYNIRIAGVVAGVTGVTHRCLQIRAKVNAVAVADKTGYALTSAYDPAKTASQAGDAMALTSGERTTLTGVIWAALTSALTAVGSIGKLLADNINATIDSRSSHSAADVWASGTRTLTSFGTLVADVATAVWAAGTRTLTSFGTLVSDMWANGTRTLTSLGSALVDEVWNRLRSAAARPSGSFGDYLDAKVSLVSGGGGGGSGIHEISVHVQNASSVGISGVGVQIYDDDGVTPATDQSITDTGGDATFNLDDGDYLIRVRSSPRWETIADTPLTVSAPATVEIELSELVVSPPAYPDVCRVYGWLIRPDGKVVGGSTITFSIPGTAEAGDFVVDTAKKVSAISRANGYFEADLLLSSVIDADYTVKCVDAQILGTITVPDAATANLATLLAL